MALRDIGNLAGYEIAKDIQVICVALVVGLYILFLTRFKIQNLGETRMNDTETINSTAIMISIIR